MQQEELTYFGDLEPDTIRAECILVRVKGRQSSIGGCSQAITAAGTIHGSILLMTENDAIGWPALSFGFLTILTTGSSLITFELAGATC